MIPPAWRICWRRWVMAPATTAEGADMVILNTCHIREKAAEKVYSELGRLAQTEARTGRRHAGRRGRLRRPGRRRRDRCARQPAVDMVVGPQSYHRLPEMIARACARPGPCAGNRFSRAGKIRCPAASAATPASAPFSPCRKAATNSAPSAWCPIRAGRNIPARPKRSCAEARSSGGKGAREIVLLGQNVNAYRGRDATAKTGLWRG